MTIHPQGLITPTQNQLLAQLCRDTQRKLFPLLDLVSLKAGSYLHASGEYILYAYFPVNAIVSLCCLTEDGACAEVSLIGNEGFVGTPLIMGTDSSPNHSFVTNSGYAFRLARPHIVSEFQKHQELADILLVYIQTLMIQMAQNVICNRHHSIDQQLCRWLLHSLDRLPGNLIDMTQNLIANMLGVRREGVTEAALKLKKMKVIDYHRGHIKVLDRERLERFSCECYNTVRQEYLRLFPESEKMKERRTSAR